MNGLLGKAVAGNGIFVPVYTAPSTAGSHSTVNISVCNTTSAEVAITLAISTGASPLGSDYLDYEYSIPANGHLERTGIVMSPSESVLARASTAGISVRVHGFQKGA